MRGRWTFADLKRLHVGLGRPVVMGEVCFVGGWSLMWATALDIVPHVPVVLWLSMIVVGLVLAGGSRRRVRLAQPATQGDGAGHAPPRAIRELKVARAMLRTGLERLKATRSASLR